MAEKQGKSSSFKNVMKPSDEVDKKDVICEENEKYTDLVCVLVDTKPSLVPELSVKDIQILRGKWSQLFDILLPSLSVKLVDVSLNSSFYQHGGYDEADIVCSSLRILKKFAEMKMFEFREFKAALSCIGIFCEIHKKEEGKHSGLENVDQKSTIGQKSEVIFCLTLDSGNSNINSEKSKEELCAFLQKGIQKVLESSKKIEWLKGLLNEDETFAEKGNIDYDNVIVNVIDIFPGSHKVVIQFRYFKFPEDPEEVNSALQVFQLLLENLPSVTKVRVDEEPVRSQNGILRMKLSVGNKYFSWGNKKKLEETLKTIIHDVRTLVLLDRNSIEESLSCLGLVPTSIEALLKNLYESDTIEVDIEPPKQFYQETMRLKNIPLWPSDKTRLLELSNETQYEISDLFYKTFGKEISWEDVVGELDVLKDNLTYINLQKDIHRGMVNPYPTIINTYKEKSGTIGGLLKCLDKIQTKNDNNEEVTPQLRVKMDDLISYIHCMKEKHVKEWRKKLKPSDTIVESFNKLEKILKNYDRYGSVIRLNLSHWKEVIEEGDQIWMWREGSYAKPSYAYVGIFIGEDSMIHVQQQGLSGTIKKDRVEDILKGSKFLIVRPSIETLSMISGTPKERALACLGLKFTYSVNSGNCEVFTNIACHGRWDVCNSVQRDGHPHVDRLVTVLNGISHLQVYKDQQIDLVTKLAKRLLLEGIIDDNLIQISKAFVAHENISSEITQKMSKETKLARYRLIVTWEMLEAMSNEEKLFTSDWSSDEIGRIAKQVENSFQSSALILFNNLPKQMRNLSNCSIADFAKSLDLHLVSLDDNLETGLFNTQNSSETLPDTFFDTQYLFLWVFVLFIIWPVWDGIVSLFGFCLMLLEILLAL